MRPFEECERPLQKTDALMLFLEQFAVFWTLPRILLGMHFRALIYPTIF